MQCEFSSIHRMATDIEEGRDISLKLISIHLQEWQWTLTQASGEEVQNPHIVPTPKIKLGQSPSLLLTIQDLTKGISPQTASSGPANFAIQPLTHSQHRNELQNTPSWAQWHFFCIFCLHWLFSYTINSPGGLLARGRKTNQADLSTVSRAGNRYL